MSAAKLKQPPATLARRASAEGVLAQAQFGRAVVTLAEILARPGVEMGSGIPPLKAARRPAVPAAPTATRILVLAYTGVLSTREQLLRMSAATERSKAALLHRALETGIQGGGIGRTSSGRSNASAILPSRSRPR